MTQFKEPKIGIHLSGGFFFLARKHIGVDPKVVKCTFKEEMLAYAYHPNIPKVFICFLWIYVEQSKT